MSSDVTRSPENGCTSSEEFKTRKNLKSAVITDNDPLKIKLKISKREDVEPGRNKKESSVEAKSGKNHRSNAPTKSELKNGDEKCGEEFAVPEERVPKTCNAGEPKMKLRSKRETEEESSTKEECEIEETSAERRKRKEFGNDRELDKPSKKRGKTIKCQGDEFPEKVDEVTRRRSRRNESEIVDQDKSNESADESKDVNKESFCWSCHKDGSVVKCDTCPRVFHLKCVSLNKDPSKDWICPECSLVLHAEKMSTRSEAMKSLSLDQLCTLLNFAIGRMKNVPESQAFWKPVDPKEVPLYDKYITNPMDLNLLERNMKAKMYGSPQAFLADAKWLLHNSIIFNSSQSPLTSTARFLVKICRQEMAEIENCPDCYLNAHTKEDWFIEVCRKPHILIWARLKGFPFWPAKAMSTNLKTQQVDARFFGAHDKAWVPVKECYLYSKASPQLLSKKRTDLDDAFLEVEGYIKKIRQKYGVFSYAPEKTPFMPEMYDKQLQSMIPNYKEEKQAKKKWKGTQSIGENGAVEKPVQNGKKISDHGTPHRFKLKRPTSEESTKVDGDLCPVNDYVSEEKIVNDDRISPEDEIARSLEMFDTHEKTEGETVDENSTDLDEDGSVPIPEHGYSLSVENLDRLQQKEEDPNSNGLETENEKDENEAVEKSEESLTQIDCVAESSDVIKSTEGGGKLENANSESPANNDQCEVSSTSADLKVTVKEDRDVLIASSNEFESSSSNVEDGGGSSIQNEAISSQDRRALPVKEKSDKEKSSRSDPIKKDEDKGSKSFVNLSVDQKQKILTEAKLLANIDEMTALAKQKVLNELGLDASQIDIRQLAQENRQILETLNKKGQNERKGGFEEVSTKDEDFEQYLIEENNDENIFREDLPPESPRLGSIKVRDFHTLSKSRSRSPSGNSSVEPMLKITDVQSLRDRTTKESKCKRKKSFEESIPLKKLKLEPVIELIKLDGHQLDKTVENLNRKLRLSDEVSLLMVDGEKKVNVHVNANASADPDEDPDEDVDVDVDVDVEVECGESVVKKITKKSRKSSRARKSLPNKGKDSVRVGDTASKTSPKTVNVISVDTENSLAQKNLLKSLCLEERKPEDSGRKTVLITTGEKGIKNVDVKNTCEPSSVKKQIKEVTIEAVKDSERKGTTETGKEGSLSGQKNLAVVNSHLIVTNQNNQPNLALTQNNLGQLSLVHLTNLSSGIQTNFVNLTNETIGFNNSVGTLYASPGIGAEFPSSSAASSSVILTPSLTTSLSGSGTTVGSTTLKGPKSSNDLIKLPINRVGSSKPTSGISVKSPASLGLVASQPSKLPPLIAIPGEGLSLVGEVGSVTAELNKHSIKMAEYMRTTIEDILRDLSNQGSLEAKCKLLTIEMEKLQWRHQQEIMELKHHSERSIMELRSTLESDKQKCLGELKAQLETQHQKAISETKRKQWCANCGKEALFYCCWNTSYCDYPCQQQHWPGHMSTCAQLANNVNIGSSTGGSQLQGKTPGMKYHNSNYVPIMSRGGGSNCGNNGSGGSHTGGPFAANRAIPTVQAQSSSQGRRSSDPSTPQLPINITIRPQHYFM